MQDDAYGRAMVIPDSSEFNHAGLKAVKRVGDIADVLRKCFRKRLAAGTNIPINDDCSIGSACSYLVEMKGAALTPLPITIDFILYPGSGPIYYAGQVCEMQMKKVWR